MRKALFLYLVFSFAFMKAQTVKLGLDWAFAPINNFKHDVINIDTNYYNGNFFYLKNIKPLAAWELPSIYTELSSKNKFFVGARFSYSTKRYQFDEDENYQFSNSDYYENTAIYTRLYVGKEFLVNKLVQPWLSIGFGNYRYTNHYFDNQTDASLKYDFRNYVDWLNVNLKSVNVLSFGAGLKMKIYGFYAYHDRTFAPINQYMHSFTSTSYLVLKVDLLGKNIAKKIPIETEDFSSLTKKRAYVKPNAFGFSLEHPFSGGFNLAKDTVTGFEIAYGVMKEPESIENGYAFDGFLSVEVEKKAKMKFSPQVSMYYERSIKESNNWFIRHALSFRAYKFIYERAAKNYQPSVWLYLNDESTGTPDLSYNELDIKNNYAMIANEHKIGYRFISSSKPNYFVLNAGLRMNWRLKHWNNFTSKVRFINPTASVGLMYKSNKFSIGVNAEHSIISPDKNKYYKNFYSLGVQLNYDIQRWDK